jgi:hypothetical protein
MFYCFISSFTSHFNKLPTQVAKIIVAGRLGVDTIVGYGLPLSEVPKRLLLNMPAAKLISALRQFRSK